MPLWSWLLAEFGMPGALLMLFAAGLCCLAWLFTAVGVWRLLRQNRRMEQSLLELREQTAVQNRRQQVQRLQRDKGQNKPGRRR